MSTHTRTPPQSAGTLAVNTAARRSNNRLRVRWAAIGAAIAVTLGAGTIATVDAIQTSGERLTYVATDPCRLLDTRPEPQFNVGPRATPLGPAEAITVAARGTQGQCTPAQLPNDAAALALNITIPTATANGFLTVWSIGPRPNASSLNPAPGEPPTPNGVDTTLTPGGTFNIYNHAGFTHVIIDVVGHHVDHNHDDRYYTKAGTRDVATPTFTKLEYSGQSTMTTGASTMTKLRDLGTFTSSGGTVKITWVSNVVGENGGQGCDFGLRVDGQGSGPANFLGLVGTEAQIGVTTFDVHVMTVDVFTSLPAGHHDLELHVRRIAGTDCVDNLGDFTKDVLIEEYPA